VPVPERLFFNTVSRADNGAVRGEAVRPGAGEPLPGQPERPPSRLRGYVLAEALAVALGYAVTTLKDGPPNTPGQWSLVLGGAVAVAIPLWIKSRREIRQEALLLVRFHDFPFVEDVHAETLPPGVDPKPGSKYRSFISAAVFCGEQSFGMLSVDAPVPHAFDETDLNVVRAMAQLLGAGLVEGPVKLAR